MAQLRLTVQSITPLLMYGADNKDDRTNTSLKAKPELRATGVRGVLRYWLRAVLGNHSRSSSEVFEQESQILGSTEVGSRVALRVYQSGGMEEERNLTVLPKQTRGYNLPFTGFPPESEFRITLSTHPLDRDETLLGGDLLKAVFLMATMSGLGRRARRGSGNLRVLDVKGYEGEGLPLDYLPEDQSSLSVYLQEVSHYVCSTPLGRQTDFPVFATDTAVVLLSQQVHTDYEDAFQELWRVSGPYHHEGGIFGDVRPRRASAIHMRVSATNRGYVAQQTILYSGRGNWQQMQNYIQHCQSQGFQAIYGSWGHWK